MRKIVRKKTHPRYGGRVGGLPPISGLDVSEIQPAVSHGETVDELAPIDEA